jgi:hypothetical protein
MGAMVLWCFSVIVRCAERPPVSHRDMVAFKTARNCLNQDAQDDRMNRMRLLLERLNLKP